MSEKKMLPPGQQLVGPDKWPFVGERESLPPLDPWVLEVGSPQHTWLQWTLPELRQLETDQKIVDIHCVTRWSKLGVRFTGIRLQTILQHLQEFADVDLGPYQFVSFQAHTQRNHSTSLSLPDALKLDTLVAWEVDGSPLPAEHGGPLRNIVPERYFYKSVKWLKRIELLTEDRLGFWESDAGYHNHADPWREERYLAPTLDKRSARQLLESRDFSNKDLRGLHAGQRDLSQLQASHALLRDAHFENSVLREANFQYANLSNAHFQGADLQNANFENADLEGADFSGANLQGATFSGASLFGASFTGPHSAATRLDPAALTPQQIATLTDQQAAWVRQQ